jgi:hypothetical protein
MNISRAPRRVDDESGRLEERQSLGVEQVPRRVGERGVDADVVADAQQLIELHTPGLQPFCDVGWR